MQNPTENNRKPDSDAGCAVADGSASTTLTELVTSLAGLPRHDIDMTGNIEDGFQLETEQRGDGEWVRWSDIRELLESPPNTQGDTRPAAK